MYDGDRKKENPELMGSVLSAKGETLERTP